MSVFDTVIIDAGGPGAGVLAPGRVLRALALGAGVPADNVGTIVPTGHGRVAVEIAGPRAHRLSTPRFLSIVEAGRETLLVMRRESDPPDEGRFALRVTWDDAGSPPSPGVLAAAVAGASHGRIGAEDLGVGWFGAGWGEVSVPARLLFGAAWPSVVEADGRRFTLNTLNTLAASGPSS